MGKWNSYRFRAVLEIEVGKRGIGSVKDLLREVEGDTGIGYAKLTKSQQPSASRIPTFDEIMQLEDYFKLSRGFLNDEVEVMYPVVDEIGLSDLKKVIVYNICEKLYQYIDEREYFNDIKYSNLVKCVKRYKSLLPDTFCEALNTFLNGSLRSLCHRDTYAYDDFKEMLAKYNNAIDLNNEEDDELENPDNYIKLVFEFDNGNEEELFLTHGQLAMKTIEMYEELDAFKKDVVVPLLK